MSWFDSRATLHLIFVGGILLLLPGLGLPLGSGYLSSIPEKASEEKIDAWRSARLAFRLASFSPLFWEESGTRTLEADNELSTAMFDLIVEGNSGAFNQEQHIHFLETREDKIAWGVSLAEAQFRYGHPSESLATISNIPAKYWPTVASFGQASALGMGNEEALTIWIQRDPDPPLGLLELASISGEESATPHPFWGRLNSPESIDWLQLEVEDVDIPLRVEGYARFGEVDSTILEQSLSLEPSLEWRCAQLAALPHFPAAERLALAKTIQKGLSMTSAHLPRVQMVSQPTCHPDLFAAAGTAIPLDENVEMHRYLTLWAAHAYLARYDIGTAQSLLGSFKGVTLEHAMSVHYFYLRAMAREMAGDLTGVEKYAQQGMKLDANLFTVFLGKAAMLKTQKTEAIWVLHEQPNINLPKGLEGEFNDLSAVAQRLNGSAVKILLHGEEVAYGTLERSTDFRIWFAKHMGRVTSLPHTPIPSLAILVNNSRVERDGDFLLNFTQEETVNPVGIVTRAHLQFLFASIAKKDATDRWKAFMQARTILDKITFPQLIARSPENYTIHFQNDAP